MYLEDSRISDSTNIIFLVSVWCLCPPLSAHLSHSITTKMNHVDTLTKFTRHSLHLHHLACQSNIFDLIMKKAVHLLFIIFSFFHHSAHAITCFNCRNVVGQNSCGSFDSSTPTQVRHMKYINSFRQKLSPDVSQLLSLSPLLGACSRGWWGQQWSLLWHEVTLQVDQSRWVTP